MWCHCTFSWRVLQPLHWRACNIKGALAVHHPGSVQCRSSIATCLTRSRDVKSFPPHGCPLPVGHCSNHAATRCWSSLPSTKAPVTGGGVAGSSAFQESTKATKPTQPLAANIKEESPWELIRTMWPHETSHQLRIAFALIGLVGGKVLAILAPLQLGRLVDTLGSGVEVLPVGILAAYGLARISTSLVNELRAAIFATVSQASCRALARRSFEHLHSLDVSYLNSSKPGALNVVISRATKSLTQVVNMLLFNVLPIAVEFAMALVVMASLAGPGCALVAAGTIGIYVVFTTRFSQHRREIMRSANRAEEEASAVFFDSLGNCEAVKYFQNEALELQRYDAVVAQFEANQVRSLHTLAQLNFGQQIIVVSGFTTLLSLTAAQVLNGSLPMGNVVAIHGILAQLMQPLGILGGVYRVTTQGFVDLGKLAGFLKHRTELPPPENGGAAFVFEGGGLEFHDVHHAYASSGSSVLAGVSLVVPAGTKMALVGPSGSGKTTLLRLLYRLSDPQHGHVLIDGQDVRHLNLDSFRQHLGIVPQDCTLFNESVGFNIRYGQPGASDTEVEAAARLAQIHDVIESFPQGYNTPVGQRGMMLSGGERQRIGIARCLLRNPSIVLLDEATSSLDVRTERQLTEAMDALMVGRTCLVVAHRLSTVQRCDSVAFLEEGAVRELGSHDELMGRSDRYRGFWEGLPAEN